MVTHSFHLYSHVQITSFHSEISKSLEIADLCLGLERCSVETIFYCVIFTHRLKNWATFSPLKRNLPYWWPVYHMTLITGGPITHFK